MRCRGKIKEEIVEIGLTNIMGLEDPAANYSPTS